MNKSVPLLLFLFSVLNCGLNNGIVYANQNDTSPPFEESYTQIGYKTIEEAVMEFENHFQKDVKLPFLLPSIPFTHHFGRFTEDKEYDMNDSLSVEFINEKSPENHYSIDIRHLKNKITIKDRGNQQVYRLKNGHKAIFIIERNFNILVFEKDNWQYMLGIDKRIANKVTPEGLVAIANSIDYVPKKGNSFLN